VPHRSPQIGVPDATLRMDEQRIVVELPEVDRETFEKCLARIEAIAAQMEPSELKDNIVSLLAEMRTRLSRE
jgi:hypothetical protein